jgi:hypothetical protein
VEETADSGEGEQRGDIPRQPLEYAKVHFWCKLHKGFFTGFSFPLHYIAYLGLHPTDIGPIAETFWLAPSATLPTVDVLQQNSGEKLFLLPHI